MSGWFAMSRSMFDHPIFEGHAERVGVWAWMLSKAAWKDTRQDANGKTVTVNRGQLLTSYRQMSKATGVPIQPLRTLIGRLQDEHAINTDTNTGRLRITICNYEKYQDAGKASNTGDNTRPTRDQHTTNTQKEQVNKYNNIPVGEADASEPAQISIMSSVVWDAVPRFLRMHGIDVKQARSMTGKWLKDTTPAELLAAVDAAQRAATQDPIPYITETLKAKQQPSKPLFDLSNV